MVTYGQERQNLIVHSFDERADEKHRDALKLIFSGKAEGSMAEFAKLQ